MRAWDSTSGDENDRRLGLVGAGERSASLGSGRHRLDFVSAVTRNFGVRDMGKESLTTRPESLEQHSKLFRDLLLGFVKVHLLYHASQGPIYGTGITAELERHGYRLSPGTLYPLLHGLEDARFLEREDRVVGGKVRKYYRTTRLGQEALDEARGKIRELVDEIVDDGKAAGRKPPARARPRQSATTRPGG